MDEALDLIMMTRHAPRPPTATKPRHNNSRQVLYIYLVLSLSLLHDIIINNLILVWFHCTAFYCAFTFSHSRSQRSFSAQPGERTIAGTQVSAVANRRNLSAGICRQYGSQTELEQRSHQQV